MEPAPTLTACSERTLNLLASLVCGHPVRVVRTRRTKRALVVTAQTRTLFLDPTRASLFDLVLGAVVLRRRADLRRWRGHGDLPDAVLRPVLRLARRWLRVHLPGALLLRGARPRVAPCAPLPGVSWNHVDLAPLANEGTGDWTSISTVGGVDMAGVAQDLSALEQALLDGRVPLGERSELPGIPVAAITLDISVAHAAPALWERFEESLQAIDSFARTSAECTRKKAEGLNDRLRGVRYKTYGTRLDSTRLHAVHVGAKLGRPVPLFRQPRREAEYVFRPEEHVAVVGFDLDACVSRPGSRVRTSSRALQVLVMRNHHLGIDQQVMGLADRLVRREDGRLIYVHIRVPIKGLDEPLDGTIWSRVLGCQGLGAVPLGEPVNAHALQVAELARAGRRAVAQGGYRNVHLEYAALSENKGFLGEASWLTRGAQRIERDLDALDQELPGELHPVLIISRQLQRHAPRGGHLRAAIAR